MVFIHFAGWGIGENDPHPCGEHLSNSLRKSAGQKHTGNPFKILETPLVIINSICLIRSCDNLFGLKMFLPLNISLPKTVESLSDVLQFHLLLPNWCWHSLTPSRAPSLMLIMTSGYFRQSLRCLPTKPGILSQINPVLREWIGNWLINLEKKKKKCL
jgi:hypothetical protein